MVTRIDIPGTMADNKPPPVPADLEDRILVVLELACESDRLSEEVKRELRNLIAPENVAVTVGVLALWAASHAIGVGLVFDVAMFGVSLWMVGLSVIDAAENIGDFLNCTLRARTHDDLVRAADYLAAAIVILSVKVLQRVISKGASGITSAGKQGKAKGERKKVEKEETPKKRPRQDAVDRGSGKAQQSQQSIGAAEASVSRRDELNKKFGRTGDLNRDINRRGNEETARKFYEHHGMPKEKIPEHLRGIDFDHDVRVETLNSNKKIFQNQVPGNPQGSYYTNNPNTKPTEIGINPEGTHFQTKEIIKKEVFPYTTSQKTAVLKSTAAPVTDTWSVQGQPYATTGGGKQMYIPPSQNVKPASR